MLQIVRIRGQSLFPELNDGDFILMGKGPIFIPQMKPGDLVVFQHELYGQMIKRIKEIDAAHRKVFVLGNHDASIDSRQLGWIDIDCVVGKVIWSIKQRI